MNALIQYLLDNLMLDFSGDLTMDMVRDFLRNDESRDARALLAKLAEDRDTANMMITLADCLKDSLHSGITGDTVRDEIRTYSES